MDVDSFALLVVIGANLMLQWSHVLMDVDRVTVPTPFPKWVSFNGATS